MARVRAETVDKLIDLLSLPVGQSEDDLRPQSMQDDVQRVSQDFGWLVFADDAWYSYEPGRIEDVLANWVDERTVPEFDTVACESAPTQFLRWFEQLVRQWKATESGAAGPAAEGAKPGLLGIENPHFDPDRVPGTQFYRYVDDQYLYAATPDAPHEEWKDIETRYDEHRGPARPAPADEGLLRGYPYASSALPGTEFYRLDGESYLYGPAEFGTAEQWQPYEYWQERADEAENAQQLIGELDAFIELVRARNAQRR